MTISNGSHELRYAQPIANSLVTNEAFRAWMLKQTPFSHFAEQARVLDEEMSAKRSSSTRFWWRHHYYEKCRCPGCGGRETDLLVVFDSDAGTRFAIHFEVKHPDDRFSKHQAAAYPIRARCWADRNPPTVLQHAEAATALLCSDRRLTDFAPHLEHFDSVITFEAIAVAFPHFWPDAGVNLSDPCRSPD